MFSGQVILGFIISLILVKCLMFSGQVILGEGLRFGDQSYHRACFRCSGCGQGLNQARRIFYNFFRDKKGI